MPERIDREHGSRERESREDSPVTQDYQEIDRKWFENHPGRSHYIRRFIDGEQAPGREAGQWIAVRQVAPGIRMRLGFGVLDDGGFFDAAQTDEGAKLLFDMALDAAGEQAARMLALLKEAAFKRDGVRP
jgi:hypothetical protein